MRKQKREKGITLVALIITIVILIILAVVSITTIMNIDILGYADNSANIYGQKKEEEQGTLQGYEDYLSTNGGSGSTGGDNILTLTDVAEIVKDGDNTYSVDNGIIKLKNEGQTGFGEYGHYTPGTLTIQLPCSATLKSGVSYEIKLSTIEKNAGFYGAVSLPGINASKINYSEDENTASTVFTCEEDVNISYIDFVFTPSDDSIYDSGCTEYDDFYGTHLLWEYRYLATAQYTISIVEK